MPKLMPKDDTSAERLGTTLGGIFGGMLAIGLLVIVPIVAWVQHFVFCIQTGLDTTSEVVLLLFGAFFPPLGMLHGISIWFGYSWI